MKYILLTLSVIAVSFGVHGQNILPENGIGGERRDAPQTVMHTSGLLSRLCVDVNVTGGVLNEKVNTVNPAAAYPAALNANVSSVKFSNGASRGIDAQIGYYFDFACRYGIATGFMYMYQTGELTMDRFHIEYRSTDNFNNVFRQVLTANGPVSEHLRTSNLSIPLLFKYRQRISSTLGFSADAGLLFNIVESSHYTTNASFNYEAIYQYTGVQGNLVPVYDFLAVPAAGDLLITQSQYMLTHPGASVQDYFNAERAQGYNVGLGVKPASGSGRVFDVSGSVGILLRPAVTYNIARDITLNAGVYYIMQNFRHNAPAGYRITDKAGQYQPLANSITSTANTSYGITAGITYSIARPHPVVVVPVEDTSSVPQEDEGADESPAPKGEGSFPAQTKHMELTDLLLHKEMQSEQAQ